MTPSAHRHPETACIHAGTRIDPATGGVNTPIHTSSANGYLDRPERPYPRYFNTINQRAVVDKLCALEQGSGGVLFSSGMAAVTTVAMTFLKAGDHAVMQREMYGGSSGLAHDFLPRFGVTSTFAATNAAAIVAAITDRTRLVMIESPTNPLLSVVDIAAVAAAARARGVVTMIDNTFATPLNQNPLALGIDVVIHSGTKYLGGHSDLCCGIAVTSAEYAERIRDTAHYLGGSVNASTAAQLERSLKTLAIRVQRQTENAGRLAAFLAAHPAVARVNYPGLPATPGHEIARRQMRGFGAMLSFERTPGGGSTADFLHRLRLIQSALSLGGVDTTICDPVSTSHRNLPPAEREALGIRDTLLRLSCGIEHVEDLEADLAQALG